MGNIVGVVWYRVHPAVFGGQKGIAEFHGHLCRHLRLTTLCSTDNEVAGLPYPALPVLKGGRMGFLLPSNWSRILDALRRTGSTHLLVEHAYYGPPALLARRFTGVKVVVHAHNIESKVFRDNGRFWWPLVGLWERIAYRGADLVVFKTEDDRDFAVVRWKVDPIRTHVMPFGISRRASPTTEEREQASAGLKKRYGIPEDCRILFFCGTLDYEPNARALRWLVESLLPELRRSGGDGFKLLAAGRVRKPEYGWVLDLRDPDYVYAGELDDVSAEMTGADLFVNPVDTGGGIKVKNLEALSFGQSVLTTEHSATGIDKDLVAGKLVVGRIQDPVGFAELVVEHSGRRDPTPAEFFSRYHWEGLVAAAAERIEAC